MWNLARRNPGFTGRDGMLNRLHDTLTAGGRAAVQALYGMGGVGKTQLALEYAHRFADEYDLVWWIPAEQPELIGDHLTALTHHLRLAPAGTATPDIVQMLWAYLRQAERWLLIFDNVGDRDQIAGWLPDGPGTVLITSRNPHWTGVAAPVDVDVFTRPESVALIHANLPQLTAAAADQLAAELGDLPLAVAQAADLLTETYLPVDIYLTELAEHAADLLREGHAGADYPASLAATIALTADRLAVTDPAAAQLLYLCARLAPELIPNDLFTARPDLLPEALAEVARKPVAFARTLAQLGRYGLARLSDTGPILHRLVQAVLRDIDPDPGTHHDIVEHLLVAAKPGDASSPQWWPRWSVLLPHILATNPATTTNPGLRWTANEAVWHLSARGDVRTALPLAERLRAVWSERNGATDRTTSAISTTLADIYRKLGLYEQARDLHKDILTRTRRIHGHDHPDALLSAANLILVLTLTGENEQARELGQDTLDRSRRVLGADHILTLGSADNLAGALRRLGEVERARQLDEDTLTRRRRVLGDDHPDTLRSASNLAADLKELGEYERARQLDEDTLTRTRRVLGDDHPDTLASASMLAADLKELGEYERARQLDEDTLTRTRRVLGDDHPDTLASASNLAADLTNLGEHERARQLREQFPPQP